MSNIKSVSPEKYALCEKIYEEGQKVKELMKKRGIKDIPITCVDEYIQRKYEEYEKKGVKK